jgi:hypothetical protein
VLTNNKKAIQVLDSAARANPQLIEILTNELEERKESLVRLGDVDQLRRTQGYAQCLSDLLAVIDLKGSPRNAGSST